VLCGQPPSLGFTILFGESRGEVYRVIYDQVNVAVQR
jgi:hypothetical protein